jgi:hypothetical protein
VASRRLKPMLGVRRNLDISFLDKKKRNGGSGVSPGSASIKKYDPNSIRAV